VLRAACCMLHVACCQTFESSREQILSNEHEHALNASMVQHGENQAEGWLDWSQSV
jgi:uncharacterized protein YcaQ